MSRPRARASDRALVWKPVAAVRHFLDRPPVPDGYLTLCTVDVQRREAQLGRLEAAAEPARAWLVRLVRDHLDLGGGESRFRLRRWGAGGKPAGSVSFVVVAPVATTTVAPVATPARDDQRLVVDGGSSTLHERLARLERRLAATERQIELMKPIVEASEQALFLLGSADDEDT